jgi:hypothetical protein
LLQEFCAHGRILYAGTILDATDARLPACEIVAVTSSAPPEQPAIWAPKVVLARDPPLPIPHYRSTMRVCTPWYRSDISDLLLNLPSS